jgi:hypothetical protein
VFLLRDAVEDAAGSMQAMIIHQAVCDDRTHCQNEGALRLAGLLSTGC